MNGSDFINPISDVIIGFITRTMMLSELCFLITTPVYYYPGQLQAVTGGVAVFSLVPANSLKRVSSIYALGQFIVKALFLLKSTESVRTRQMIRVSLFASTVHCSTISWRALRRALISCCSVDLTETKFSDIDTNNSDRVHVMLTESVPF